MPGNLPTLGLTAAYLLLLASGCARDRDADLGGNWDGGFAESSDGRKVLTGYLDLYGAEVGKPYVLKVSDEFQDFVINGTWTRTADTVHLSVFKIWPAGPDKAQILLLRQPYFDPKSVIAEIGSSIDLKLSQPGTLTSSVIKLGTLRGQLVFKLSDVD